MDFFRGFALALKDFKNLKKFKICKLFQILFLGAGVPTFSTMASGGQNQVVRFS